MAARSGINLLPQEEFATSITGRILAWLTSSFRIIVIVTDMLVIIAFLSRFWLDAKRADLNDTLKVKKNVIAASASFEKEYRDIQNRTAIYALVSKDTGTGSQALSSIFTSVPENIALTTIGVNENKIRLEATALSEGAIGQWMANLNALAMFDSMNLVDVGTDPKNPLQLKFGLDLTLKQGKT